MNKKIIVLNVKRHHGEIDWILPLLYKFDKFYTLITIFDFNETYENFKKNKFLFKLWSKRNDHIYIKNKKDKIFFKIIFQILQIFQKILNLHLIKFEEFLLDKISDFEFFLKRYKINYDNLKVFFIASHNKSYLPKFVKKKNPNCKIIRFPESSWIFPSGNQNKHYSKTKIFEKNFGDYYLHTCKSNSDLFLGKSKKIIYCKNFRYESWWKKKFKKKRKNYRTFNILVATRPFDESYFSKQSYEKLIFLLMRASNEILNSKVIFKTHPHSKEFLFLKSIFKKYNFKNWEINNNHALILANEADLCVSIITSACLDFLSTNKPTIELFFSNKDANKISVKYPHYAFNKKKNEWQSIFEHLGFLKTYETTKDLLKIIKMVKAKEKKTYWNKYFIKLKKWEKNKMNSGSLKKFICKKIN